MNDTQLQELRQDILEEIEDMDIELLKRIAYECRCEENGIYPDQTYIRWQFRKTHIQTSAFPAMFSKEDLEFVDFLFGKLITHTDTDMIDLHDSDSCDDHLQFNQLSLF